MLKILFIDDNPESVIDAIQFVEEKIGSYKHWVLNFEAGLESIHSLDPDIVVIDVWKGDPQEDDPAGKDVLKRVWNQHFRPVIVYSADASIIEQISTYDHPLAEKIEKGGGSDEKVYEAVQRFHPHSKALRDTQEIIRKTSADAIRDVAPYAFGYFDDDDKRADALVRASRRRIAALMDEPFAGDTQLAPWEQYLCPPGSHGNRLGDVLKLKNSSDEDPASFRVVLTPSCDLVSGREKVELVLVAKCCGIRAAMAKLQIPLDQDRIKKSHILSKGFLEDFVIFPKLPGKIPSMAVNLKNLQLIPVDMIGEEEAEFDTIASIDSPFRELVSWAYLQVAGRPGLPERDLDGWIDEIIAVGQQSTGGDQT